MAAKHWLVALVAVGIGWVVFSTADPPAPKPTASGVTSALICESPGASTPATSCR